ncbi:MAG: type II toxin-antitoxin system VapC family toxin [Candidatus Omnitrophota bacterium]
MKNIVIDTSSIIAVILAEPEKEKLVGLTKNANLLAPASLHWEIGNAFSAMFKKKRISLNDAIAAIDIYENIPIQFIDIELKNALELAHGSNIYAYDAYMIICALSYKAPLLTLDDVLIRIAREYKIKILEV